MVVGGGGLTLEPLKWWWWLNPGTAEVVVGGGGLTLGPLKWWWWLNPGTAEVCQPEILHTVGQYRDTRQCVGSVTPTHPHPILRGGGG